MNFNCPFCQNLIKSTKHVAFCTNCMKQQPDFYISFFLDPNDVLETILVSPVNENTKFSVDLDLKLQQLSICTWNDNFFFDSTSDASPHTYFPPQPIPQFHSLAHLMEIAEQSARRFNKLKTFL